MKFSFPYMFSLRWLKASLLVGFVLVLVIEVNWRSYDLKSIQQPVQAMDALPTIMFVTQPPFGADFASANAVFGNRNPYVGSTPRGGDLYIRYSDGALRNLTAEAGFGVKVGEEIATREPSVHWSGTKALFSMVIGGTTKNRLLAGLLADLRSQRNW